MFDHQYTGVGVSAGLCSETCTISAGDPSGSHASTVITTRRIRSNSYIRSTGVPSGALSRTACSGEHVSGQCPVPPMFHSTPPASHASRSARFAGCRIGLRCNSSRPVGRCTRDHRRPP